MRIHFNDARRPSRLAKTLRAELGAHGIPLSLTQTQDLVARMFGYADYRELLANVGRHAPSPWDEACDPAAVLLRRRRQGEALLRAGLPEPAVSDILDRLRPTARRLSGDDGAGSAAPAYPWGGPIADPDEGFRALLRYAARHRVHRITVHVRQDIAQVSMPAFPARLEVDIPRAAGLGLCEAAYRSGVSPHGPYLADKDQSTVILKGMPSLAPGMKEARLYLGPTPGGGRMMAMNIQYLRPEDRDGLAGLGLLPTQVEAVEAMRRARRGLVLVAGPSDSGKDLFLDAVLSDDGTGPARVLGAPDLLMLPDRRQVPLSERFDEPFEEPNAGSHAGPGESYWDEVRRHLGPGEGLRIDSVRDRRTAALALDAQRAGQPVWAFLLAEGALSGLYRFAGMSPEPREVYSPDVVRGIVCTRVTRALCPHCKVGIEEAQERGIASDEILGTLARILPWKALKGVRFANPDGCGRCRGQGEGWNGFEGTTLVCEVVSPDARFFNLARQGRHREARDHLAGQPGALTLPEHAMLRVAAGELDPMDVKARMADVVGLDDDRLNLPRLRSLLGEAAGAAA